MNLTFGVGELMSALAAVVGIGWAILRMSFAQFEKRIEGKFDGMDSKISGVDSRFSSIDSKFQTIERLELDIKRVEVESIRAASQQAIVFATKEELARAEAKHDKTMERVFGLLQTINDKLDKKVDRDECEKLMTRKTDR